MTRASGRRLAVLQFLLSSFAVLAVVATLGVVALHRVATGEAVADARAGTAALSKGILRRAVTPQALNGDPRAIAALDKVVRQQVLLDPLVRLKLWTPDGAIFYSDESRLVGRHFALPDDLRSALNGTEVQAGVSDLSRPENRFERGRGRLLEVYLPLKVAGGRTILVETYRQAASIEAASRRIWRSFLPVVLLIVAALAIAQLPLAALLAARVRGQERERERLTRATEDALEAERRRIAAELHDGVVQDLASIAFEFQTLGDRLPPDPHPPAGGDLSSSLRRGAETCRDCIRALRTLLVDLYPAERRHKDLRLALERLAEPVRERGVEVGVQVGDDASFPGDIAEIVYRAAQEALRNVERHAGARTADVEVRHDGETVTLTVEDDGRGMTGHELQQQHAAGHMGLRLLADGVAARGGVLLIESEPGAGTRLRLALPATSRSVAGV